MARKSKTRQILGGGLILLLIVGLSVTFGASNFGQSVRIAGSVGDAEIPVDRYARVLDQEMRSFSAQIGRAVTGSEARVLGLDRAVMARLLSAAAVEHEARAIGLSAGDAAVRRELRSTPAFQGPDGSFDAIAYEFTIDRAGLTPREYEETVRVDLAGSMIEAAVTSGIEAPAILSQLMQDYLGEERTFSWINLTEADLVEALPEPSEADLKAHYDTNAESFMLPETKRIEYAWLSPEMITDTFEIDEVEIEEAYAARADEFNQPERRLVERLVFGDTNNAIDALARINAGETTFEALVEARGLELADVDMGDVTRADLGEAADIVFALEEPGIAGPTETALGPALFRVNAILHERVTPLDSVRDELEAELVGDRARRDIANQISDFEDLLAGGATIAELAAETGMQAGSMDWAEGSDEGLAAYEAFSDAVEVATPDDFSELIELEDGGVVALQVTEIVPARPEPFEDALDKVAEAWAAEQLKAALQAIAAEVSAQLENGARLSAMGYITNVETRLSRDAFLDDAPEGLLERVFELDEGESAVVVGESSVAVAQLTTIHPSDRSDRELATLAESIAEQFEQSISRDLLTAYIRAVIQEAGQSVNQAAIDAVHAQFP